MNPFTKTTDVMYHKEHEPKSRISRTFYPPEMLVNFWLEKQEAYLTDMLDIRIPGEPYKRDLTDLARRIYLDATYLPHSTLTLKLTLLCLVEWRDAKSNKGK